jgi:hypothetical protein
MVYRCEVIFKNPNIILGFLNQVSSIRVSSCLTLSGEVKGLAAKSTTCSRRAAGAAEKRGLIGLQSHLEDSK